MIRKPKRNANLIKKVQKDSESEDDTLIVIKKKKTLSTFSTKKETDHEDITVSFAASSTAASLDDLKDKHVVDLQKQEDPVIMTLNDAGELADEENSYRGLNNYKEYVNKKTSHVTQSNASRIRAGPLKAAANVRISCRFDYQPDICKDYKETGYCGYGDSCKFMHDRGDYKAGWQIDKEWEEEQARLKEEQESKWLQQEADEEEETDDLPFACFICRNDFNNPVSTKCGHFFCEKCAIQHYQKSPKCPVCNQGTQGIFLPAKEFEAKLLARKKRLEEKGQEIINV
jgi:RING finger protein 113A